MNLELYSPCERTRNLLSIIFIAVSLARTLFTRCFSQKYIPVIYRDDVFRIFVITEYCKRSYRQRQTGKKGYACENAKQKQGIRAILRGEGVIFKAA